MKKTKYHLKELLWEFWDLDGTLADTKEDNDFDLTKASPIEANVWACKKSYEEGKKIIIFTARHWDDVGIIEDWLRKYEIPYKFVICGKPLGLRFIDDKAYKPEEVVREMEAKYGKRGA